MGQVREILALIAGQAGPVLTEGQLMVMRKRLTEKAVKHESRALLPVATVLRILAVNEPVGSVPRHVRVTKTERERKIVTASETEGAIGMRESATRTGTETGGRGTGREGETEIVTEKETETVTGEVEMTRNVTVRGRSATATIVVPARPFHHLQKQHDRVEVKLKTILAKGGGARRR